jgi:sugar lactone lactonase YvrE/type II secretory pathway pseudopilin PulG
MKAHASQRGFTLIQISILLVVASIVLVAILPSTRTTLNANNATTVKLNNILTAMRGYEAKNAALPCPADASQPIGSTTYGVPAANPGTGSPGNCTGGIPAANYIDTANNVAVGMVPVRALGLSNDYALDAYGRDITYAVDTNATVCFSGTLPGKITVTDNGTANNTIAALVSHGADGHGAWIPLTGSSGGAVRLNAGSTDTNTLLNAHVNSSFTPYTPLTNFVRSPPTATFDDLLVYKSNLWTLNAAPAASASLLPSIVGPASGSYYTGQTLSFTITYSSAVTVTGTPELTLSIPQSSGSAATRYATYVSSSGNTATFSYIVQSTDYAPTSPGSVAVSSPIVLNGGSITVGGGAACLSFTAPSLTGVLLNPMAVYVVDHNLDRVQKFNSSGSYLSQFGSQGGGNGQLWNPNGMTVDSSGNIWVADATNARLEEFNSSGSYLSQFSSPGIGNGQTASMSDLAFDASGNIWVTDTGNNRVQKLSSSFSWILTIPPSGCTGSGWPVCAASSTNGRFNNPNGIAVDSGGNVWVVDANNNRVQKFNSSGTFLLGIGSGYQSAGGSIGASGTGNGQFSSPSELAIDGGGDVWVEDSSNNRVQEFNSSGTYMSQISTASPNGIAIDSSGNLWVAS